MEEIDKLLTLDEFCKALNIGKTTAYQLVRSGEMPAIRISKEWRIPRSAVVNYVNGKLAEIAITNNQYPHMQKAIYFVNEFGSPVSEEDYEMVLKMAGK